MKDIMAQRTFLPLAAQSILGDQETLQGFNACFQTYWSKIVGILYRLTGEWSEAEDLGIEVFWRYYVQMQKPGMLPDNPGGWLYRVAVNLGYNALRAKNRRKQYEILAGETILQRSGIEDPAAAVEKAMERSMVRQTLARMRPRMAQLLVLRYSGLSYNELASAIHVSPTSVGTLLARAEKEFEKAYRKLSGS
ncbi:MAG: sigma-70 family RNA polymerase sigma factor [Methanosarcinaceae archaeon]|nr:sigma-70 family RNA polymerase sigma factor [Methanosarcinaceae archaeon]